MNPGRPHSSNLTALLLSIILLSFLTPALCFAKTAVDFNPNLDYSKYKTFAIIGGVENLMMVQVDPQLFYDRLHQTINRELTKKGLREAQPGQPADLMVRYWVNPSSQVNVATMGNWAPFAPYIGSYWAWTYNSISPSNSKEDCLIIDLIDSRSKDLAWRVYLVRKIATPDKEWKKADDELTKAFGSFPPSDKEKEEKIKERDAHPGKPE